VLFPPRKRYNGQPGHIATAGAPRRSIRPGFGNDAYDNSSKIEPQVTFDVARLHSHRYNQVLSHPNPARSRHCLPPYCVRVTLYLVRTAHPSSAACLQKQLAAPSLLRENLKSIVLLVRRPGASRPGVLGTVTWFPSEHDVRPPLIPTRCARLSEGCTCRSCRCRERVRVTGFPPPPPEDG
jgi:hypothetical protein